MAIRTLRTHTPRRWHGVPFHWTVLLVLILPLAVAGAQAPAQPAEPVAPPITDAAGNPLPNSISTLERIPLGGVEQWIQIRGADVNNPVLLVLHGGPGFAMTAWTDLYQRPELERTFTVVNWDQRGAGKSYSPDLTASDMTVAKLVADTLQLTELLRHRFGQDKIFLTGHSWGSALGFLAVQQRPELYHAYIASAEAVTWNRRQQMSYDWVLEQARNAGDTDIVTALEALDPFDPTNPEHLAVKDGLLDRYRGGDIYTPGLWDEYLAYAFEGRSPYYTEAEITTYLAGMELSNKTLGAEMAASDYDLFRDFPVSAIPIHFLVGRHDHSTPGELAQEYYQFLQAPAKSFTWFENSGHTLMFDEPDRWAQELIRIAHETVTL
jgi:pimeloyl-ACP methyl ester carboxylesterase